VSTNRSYIRRPTRQRISPDAELDLWLGPGRHESPFASEEQRREAWLRHRDRLLGVLPASPGRRPQAWWDYDSPIPWPGYERERSALWRAGALTEDERVELEAAWRHHFERSHAPGFSVCMGPGKILSGDRARRAHFRHHDIPRELIKQWSAERRRNAVTIRQLQATAARGVEG
jgi:hypothetical protein